MYLNTQQWFLSSYRLMNKTQAEIGVHSTRTDAGQKMGHIFLLPFAESNFTDITAFKTC